MSVTKEIAEKLQIQPELEKSPDGYDYFSFNNGGVECEVGEFLYALVRIIKPSRVLETGTHKGIGASYIGLAMKENDKGSLITLEFQQQFIEEAKENLKKLDLLDRVDVKKKKSQDYHTKSMFKLILLDTEPDLRFNELIQFYNNLKPGGFVIIHDLHRGMCQGNVNPDHPHIKSWPFGDLPQQIKDWLKDGYLVKFNFPTPRGITCFYKAHSGDYKP